MNAPEHDTNAKIKKHGGLIGFLANNLGLSLEPSETPEGMTPQIQAEFMRQEHRGIRIILNALSHYHLPKSDPRRSASLEAVVWRLFTSQGAQASAIGFGLVASIATIYLAIQANRIAEQQTNMLVSQTRIQDEQGRIQAAIADNAVNAPYGPEIVQVAAAIGADSIEESTAKRVIVLSRALSAHMNPRHHGSLAENDLYSPERGNLLYACMRRHDSKVAKSVGYARLMMEADFSQSIQKSMNMGQISFVRANLDNSSFWDADFSGAVFDHASLRGTELINAGSYPHNEGRGPPANARTSFKQIKGEGLSFSSSVLRYVDFTGAQLRKAMFNGTTLDDVDFEGAKLIEASFENCLKMTGVKFHRAFLPAAQAFHGARMESVDLAGAFPPDEDWLKVLKEVVDPESKIGNWRTRKLKTEELHPEMEAFEDWYVIEKE